MCIVSALNRACTHALFILLFSLLSFVVIGCNTRNETQGDNQPQVATSGNHDISLADAVELTKNFRSASASGSVLAESFDQSAIRALIEQRGCKSVRIYYGKKADGLPALVLVAVDSAGVDMTSGLLIETGFPCPPICDVNSPLAK